MARPTNQDHVARTLRALAVLRSEPGWHHITRLAEIVGAKPDRLSADLRRCCYAADDWHLPLLFGSDIEPEHSDGDSVVQLAPNIPVSLPLPSSRVDVIRLALLAGSAARREPDHPSASVLWALEERLSTILDTTKLDVIVDEPTTGNAFRRAVREGRQIRFVYRSLRDDETRTRTVTPLRVHRKSKWWLLEGLAVTPPNETTRSVSYRLDRIIGEPEDAGPARAAYLADASPKDADRIAKSDVRLRMHEDDLWVTDDLAPTRIEHRPNNLVEVTISLYPPVGERLSRVLFLTDPETTQVIDGEQFVSAHRKRLSTTNALMPIRT